MMNELIRSKSLKFLIEKKNEYVQAYDPFASENISKLSQEWRKKNLLKRKHPVRWYNF
jgi:hypothetical protein